MARGELVADGADTSPHGEAKSRIGGELDHRRRHMDQSVERKAATTAAAVLGAVDTVRGTSEGEDTSHNIRRWVPIGMRVVLPDQRTRAARSPRWMVAFPNS